MRAPPLHLPLRIVVLEECVKVVDDIGVAVSHTYVSDDPERRQQTRRLSREDGITAAKIIARAMTDAVESQA